ncbi:hypothetical protein BHE74_00052799 [Ensete ventricosum]|nr:hypothetical protein BHE74_00052799 [Ensete ventricosum]
MDRYVPFILYHIGRYGLTYRSEPVCQLADGTARAAPYWHTDTWYVAASRCFDEEDKEVEDKGSVEEYRRKKEKEEKKCSDTWEAVTAAIVSKESTSIIAVKRRCCCSIAMAKRRIGNAVATSQWRSDAAVASQW